MTSDCQMAHIISQETYKQCAFYVEVTLQKTKHFYFPVTLLTNAKDPSRLIILF